VRLSCSERPRCKASLHIAGHVKPGLGDFGLDTAPIMVNHLLQFPTQGADQPRHLLADGLHLFQCADAVVAKSMNKVELSLSRAKRSPRAGRVAWRPGAWARAEDLVVHGLWIANRAESH
jgi:hypothetical protein